VPRFIKPGGAWYPLEKVSGELEPNENMTLKIVYIPKQPGNFHCKIPIYLNNDKAKPYR